MGLKHVSNRSDLLIEITFKDRGGQVIPVPMYDFDLYYYVYPERARVVSQHGRQLSDNCRIVDGKLVASIDAPLFGCGLLRTRHRLYIPDSSFQDGIKESVRESSLPFLIVEDPDEYTIEPVLAADVVAEEFLYHDILASEDGKYITTEDDKLILLKTYHGRE